MISVLKYVTESYDDYKEMGMTIKLYSGGI